jgi:16S rRNA (uracil1498-N3)-methyltransferase
MARLFVSPEQLTGERATLDEAAHRHLIKVLRLGAGAALRLFDGRGVEVEGRIVAVGRDTVEVSLGERRQVQPAVCAITLIQSVPRGDRMDLIVQKTTELGVGSIVPVLSQHGVSKPPPGRTRRWQTIAEEAARQSGRADVPTICEPVALLAALAKLDASLDESRYLLWEGEQNQSLHRALVDRPARVAVLVGPEGGFASAEVEACVQAGFRSVGLGPRILRTETAAIVAVALCQAAGGGLD